MYMENPFENNDTIRLNLAQTLNRRKEENHIELNFEARNDELDELAGLGFATSLMLNSFELPDSDEYDTFSDFLCFCKKLTEVLPEDDAIETAQISLVVTKKELKATEYLLSHAMSIFSRDENISNLNANKAILIESFRRRLIKAAGE